MKGIGDKKAIKHIENKNKRTEINTTLSVITLM
jgi:hypothetical protein